MIKTKLLAPLLLLLSISIDSGAASLDSLVRANNLNAAVVVKSLKTGKLDVYNPQRAALQFLPASTFKIPNTLIALQTHAIRGLHDTIRWDGQHRSVDAWNHDQDLLSAFPYSCVWFYQVLAARIGNDTYLQYLQKLHYGNQLTGTDVTTFWLDGELRISALEQIGFLEKVFLRKLPFEDEHYDLLNRVMLADSTANYRMYAKTGWSARVEVETGWYVGWVITPDDVWFFACNLQINQESDALFRKELSYRFLRDLHIIPESNSSR